MVLGRAVSRSGEVGRKPGGDCEPVQACGQAFVERGDPAGAIAAGVVRITDSG